MISMRLLWHVSSRTVPRRQCFWTLPIEVFTASAVFMVFCGSIGAAEVTPVCQGSTLPKQSEDIVKAVDEFAHSLFQHSLDVEVRTTILKRLRDLGIVDGDCVCAPPVTSRGSFRAEGSDDVVGDAAVPRSASDPIFHVMVAWFLCSCSCVLALLVVVVLWPDVARRPLTTPVLIDETSVGILDGVLRFLIRGGSCFCGWRRQQQWDVLAPAETRWAAAWLSSSRSPPAPSEAAAVAAALDRFFDARGVHEPRIVLAADARACVRTLAFAAGEASRRDLALPSAVFYGPPGTGKTLTARRLARSCGLDYAFMSGASVAGLGDRAVCELRRVMLWANRPWSRGLVLFVDEADSFLSARNGAYAGVPPAGGHGPLVAQHAGVALAVSQHRVVQAAASLFLAHTSGADNRLLVILAANRLEDVDPTVVSRMSYAVEFGTPGLAELRCLLEDRVERIGRLLGPEARDRLLADCRSWAAPMHPWVAFHARGFSGRDVDGLVEDFARQWRLWKAFGGIGSIGMSSPEVSDDPSWLLRWMSFRDGRLPQSRRMQRTAAAAA
eukprot:TRINITY_DN73859_c0_g1_i1.p1 TRINITY_DN73859_c0_g1~~TRINITY_DN73859_c0_g1_i1.p1  ORF type:complete len:554 (-),score=79.30 TRINITY_DN73859_c0_g1_i1:161-1822(-)